MHVNANRLPNIIALKEVVRLAFDCMSTFIVDKKRIENYIG